MKKNFLSTVVTVLGLEFEEHDDWQQSANATPTRCPHCREPWHANAYGLCHECNSSPYAPPSGFGPR